MEYKFNPEVELNDQERALLVHLIQSDGFRVLQKVMRSTVDAFVVDVINADPAKPEDVVAKQVLAKAASEFYQTVVSHLNEQKTLYVAAPRANDEPVDVTEGVLDLGNIADELEGVPNLLGGE